MTGDIPASPLLYRAASTVMHNPHGMYGGEATFSHLERQAQKVERKLPRRTKGVPIA